MRRLSVSVLVLVALLGSAAIVFLRSRPATITTSTDSPASSATVATATDQRALPQTSEELIAAALKAGEISYEQSLLARAYAMYDDPRLPKQFRSPVVDWEAGTALGIEMDDKETTLSNQILEQLAPFRARPNDPISIFNRPRDEVLKVQQRPATGWVDTLVPGTNVRIWIKGTESQLDRFVPMVVDVWGVLPIYFAYPNKDDGSPASTINRDTAVDVYFVNGGDIDPRSDDCAQPNPNPNRCILQGHGVTWSATPKSSHASSAYCIVNSQHPDNEVMETIAHELAHAAQAKYDYRELETPESRWLREGSATWVAHHVMKHLRKRPKLAYESLENNIGEEDFKQTGIFQNLHKSLNQPFHWYGTWLFFFYASMELGDDVVRQIWEADAKTGLDGVDAVNSVVALAHHFPRFAVRNWNHDPEIIKRYRTQDDTFPPGLRPSKINEITTPPKVYELEAATEPLPHLASAYFHFTFPSTVRRVTFENLYNDLEDARIWAIPKIGTWRDPEDWSGDLMKVFCRDFIDQDLEELVLIVSNSHLKNALPPGHPRPRVLSESNGCPHLRGWAETTLHVKDAGQDATYASGRVSLRFMPRVNQDQPGNVQYDLMPTTVTWTASGRKGDCTLSGAAAMPLGGLPMPSNGAGYMNVVGLDGGDFHSIVIISAPRPPIKKTCPGPKVLDDYVPTGVLLQIISEPNRVEAGTAIYKGKQTIDFGNPASLIPSTDATWVMPPFLPGATGSDLSKALEAARSARPTQSIVYTFTWELSPINGALPPAGPGPLSK